MSDGVGISAPETSQPGLTQMQRVVDTFIAPSKTFEDIKQGNRSWWMPFLIGVIVTYIFAAVVTTHIGWKQVATNVIHFTPKAEERLAQAPPEQVATQMKWTEIGTEIGFFANPVFSVIFSMLGALVLMATINFGFGGKANYWAVVAVWFYAWLPRAIQGLLGTVTTYFGEPDAFNLNNFAPTNVGAFLNPLETNAAVYKLATALDLTTIWSMILLSIGIAIVAGTKRTSGYIAVFGWWALFVLGGIGIALITG